MAKHISTSYLSLRCIISPPYNVLIKFTEYSRVCSQVKWLDGTYMQVTVENEWLFESCSRRLRIFVDFDTEFLWKEKEEKKLWENYFAQENEDLLND